MEKNEKLENLNKKPSCVICGKESNLIFGANPINVKKEKNFAPKWICIECLDKIEKELKAA